MLRLIAIRLAMSVPVVLVVVTLVFLLVRLTGDPATVLAGDMASPEVIAAITAQLGLDKPLLHQYGIWILELLRGDFGVSIASNQSVIGEIAGRLEPTLVLAVSSILLTVVVAVPMGVIAARRHNSWTDRLLMLFSVAGFSIPSFVLGYLFIICFALWLDVLPVQGYVSPFDDPVGALRHLALPTLTLSVFFMSLIARVARASILEILGEDFVRTARAKGVPERVILWKHALRNAAVPIVTVIGIGIGMLISGVVVTESVFNLPGVGRLTIDAILARDYPVVQGVIIFFSLAYVSINLLIDIAYIVIDPRIRY
ncbi:ABC transporter permease [Tistrella sp. BH-R2-4]|uniref:ABC transporter permease n=1 Tax=Tistrella arctica TaxID=3133430 RepID=A0ABU9YS01_9PROT